VCIFHAGPLLRAMRLVVLLCSLLLASTVAAQPMATVQRPCSSVASPADLAPLDTLPPGTRLAVNVTLDTDPHFAAVRLGERAAYVPRTCLSLGFLPPEYVGTPPDSMMKLATALLGLAPAKGEFETTAEYAERVAMMRRFIRVDGRTADSTFVVSVLLLDTELPYNADRSEMTLNLDTQSRLPIEIDIPDFPPAPGDWTYTYFGTASLPRPDARGRATRQRNTFAMYLGMEGQRYGQASELLRPFAFYVPRREAAAVRERLRLALTVRVLAPYIGGGVGTNNRGEDEARMAFYTRLEALRVYDDETGRVYARRGYPEPVLPEKPSATARPAPVGVTAAASTPAPSPPSAPPQPEFVAVERQPAKLSGPDPVYPTDLCRAGVEGRVVARAWIQRDGSVSDVQILRSDNSGFEAPVRTAMLQWRFEPAVQAGNPVPVWMTIPLRFRRNELGCTAR